MERQKARGGIVAERRSGGNGMDESNGRHDGDGRPDESAEHDSLPYSFGLTHALHGTHSHQSLTFPPGRAGRERRLSGRVREVHFRHVVSHTAPASFAAVRARVVKRPERRSLRS